MCHCEPVTTRHWFAMTLLVGYVDTLVILDPLIDLGLGQTGDVLAGVGRSLATAHIHKIQSIGGLEQDLFITGRIAVETDGDLLDHRCSLSVVFLFADDLLHGKTSFL